MSSDNYYLVRRNPLGGFSAVMGFASIGSVPRIHPDAPRFARPEEALASISGDYAEYGAGIHPECFSEPLGAYNHSEVVDAFTRGGIEAAEPWEVFATDLLQEAASKLDEEVLFDVYGSYHPLTMDLSRLVDVTAEGLVMAAAVDPNTQIELFPRLTIPVNVLTGEYDLAAWGSTLA